MSNEVAVIGAGRMGAAIAGRLALAGARVRVWNRTHARAAALTAANVSAHEDLGEAVRWADAVVVILTDGDAVRAVLPDLAAAVPPHAVCIEASTIDPATMDEVERVLPCRVVSAAVSGTPGVVSAGDASMFVSGHDAALDAAAPVVGMFAARQVRVGGGVRDAKLVKIGVNAVLAGTMELLAESAVLLEANGVDREVFADALAGSVLASTFIGYKSAALRARDYAPTFATRDLRKDVSLALGQARSSGVDLPFAQRLLALLDECVAAGWGDADFLSLVPRLQAASGLSPDLPPAT